MRVTKDKLKEKLLKKVEKEQQDYTVWLQSLPPSDILRHAFEYASREDILCALDDMYLEDDDVNALLSMPDTMSEIYESYLNLDDPEYMDTIRWVIEATARRED